jgi:hypothetical protein
VNATIRCTTVAQRRIFFNVIFWKRGREGIILVWFRDFTV